MNIHSLRAAWATVKLGVTDAEFRVAMALADHADRDGIAWPGRKRIAEVTGKSEATVKRALAGLRALGVLEVLSRGTGPGRLTRYRLRLKPSDDGGQVVPFPAKTRVMDDPRSTPQRGSYDAQTRVIQSTQYPYSNHKTRARADSAPVAPGDDAKAMRLVESLERGGERALVLTEWKTPEVLALAIERYGADAALLARRGCKVPPTPTTGAPSGDGRSHEETSGDAGDGFADGPRRANGACAPKEKRL